MDPTALFRTEVEDLHAFFESWFSTPPGESSRSIAEMRDRLDEEFWIVVPDGAKINRDRSVAGVEVHAGDRPTKISIHSVQVSAAASSDDLIVGTYVERHERAGVVTERLSTAAITRDDGAPTGWRWMFVHETWIPPANH